VPSRDGDAELAIGTRQLVGVWLVVCAVHNGFPLPIFLLTEKCKQFPAILTFQTQLVEPVVHSHLVFLAAARLLPLLVLEPFALVVWCFALLKFRHLNLNFLRWRDALAVGAVAVVICGFLRLLVELGSESLSHKSITALRL